jgi:hypothetical protein
LALNPDPGVTLNEDLASLSMDGTLKLWKVFGNQKMGKGIFDTTHIDTSWDRPDLWELGLPEFDQIQM